MSIRFFNTDFIAVDGETIIENNGYLKIKDKETAEIGQVFGKKADGSFGFVDVSNADMIDGKHAITEPLTEEKNDIISMINEVFGYANDGKTVIAQAIANKGVEAENTETFLSLAGKIGEIKDSEGEGYIINAADECVEVYENYNKFEITKASITNFSKIDPRTSHRGISTKDYAFFSAGGNKKTIDVYNKDLVKITLEDRVVRVLGAIGKLDEKIFSGGGTINETQNLDINVYDRDLVKTVLPNLRDSGSGGCYGSLPNYVIAGGGYRGGTTNSRAVDAYDRNYVRTNAPEPSQERNGARNIDFDNRVFSIGGNHQNTHFTNIDVYNDDLSRSLINVSYNNRECMGASTKTHMLIAGGGTNQGSRFDTVNIFNKELTRTIGPSLSVARWYGESITIGDDIYIVGGSNSKVIDKYDKNFIRTTFEPLDQPMESFAIAEINNRIIFAASTDTEVRQYGTKISISKGSKYNLNFSGDQVAEEDVDIFINEPVYGYKTIPSKKYIENRIEVIPADPDNRAYGKVLISNSINSKGVHASADETFRALSDKIKNIEINPVYNFDESNCGYRIFDNYYADNKNTISTIYKLDTDLFSNLNNSVRATACGTTVGNYAIIAGGYGSVSKKVEAYDNNLILLSLPDFPHEKLEGAATTIENYGLFTGVSRKVDVYDNNLIKLIAPDLVNANIYNQYNKSQWFTATTVGNYAMFGGGQNVLAVSTYDKNLIQISGISNLSNGAWGKGSATIGDYAIFIGGNSGKAVDIYDKNLVKSTLDQLPLNGNVHCKGASNSKYAMIAGGSNGNRNNVHDKVFVYDENLVKSTDLKLGVAREFISSAALADQIIFAGGDANNDSPLSAIDIFDINLIRNTELSLTNPNTQLVGNTLNNYAIFAGGSQGKIDVFSYGLHIDILKGSFYKLNSTEVLIADNNIRLVFTEPINGYIKIFNKICKGDIEETLQISEDSLTGKILITELLKQNGIDASIEESFASLTTKIKNLL